MPETFQQWGATIAFYNAMEERAQPTVVEGQEVQMFIGGLTSLMREVAPAANYKTVRDNLTNLGCIVQVKRGGGKGSGASIVYLLQSPESAFNDKDGVAKLAQTRRQLDTKSANKDALHAMNRRLKILEEDIVFAFRQIRRLEEVVRADPRLEQLLGGDDEVHAGEDPPAA